MNKAIAAIRDASSELRSGAQAQHLLRGVGKTTATLIDEALQRYKLCAERKRPFTVADVLGNNDADADSEKDVPAPPLFVLPKG